MNFNDDKDKEALDIYADLKSGNDPSRKIDKFTSHVDEVIRTSKEQIRGHQPNVSTDQDMKFQDAEDMDIDN